jgi:hypothetical protein
MEARIREEVERQLVNGRIVTQYDYDELQRLRKIVSDLGIYGTRLGDYDRKRIRDAMAVLDRLHIVRNEIETLRNTVRMAHKQATQLLAEDKQECPGAE